jgi:hypothetical protein
MNTEIKPEWVGSHPICTFSECPACGKTCGYEDKGNTCWPAVERMHDALKSAEKRIETLEAQINNMLTDRGRKCPKKI